MAKNHARQRKTGNSDYCYGKDKMDNVQENPWNLGPSQLTAASVLPVVRRAVDEEWVDESGRVAWAWDGGFAVRVRPLMHRIDAEGLILGKDRELVGGERNVIKTLKEWSDGAWRRTRTDVGRALVLWKELP